MGDIGIVLIICAACIAYGVAMLKWESFRKRE